MKRIRLAQRRKAMGLSQEKLAERLGVDPSTVRRWERADTDPQPWHRPNLARALGVSLDELELLLTDMTRSDLSTIPHGALALGSHSRHEEVPDDLATMHSSAWRTARSAVGICMPP